MYMQSTLTGNARLDEAQAGVKIGYWYSTTSRYADNTTFMVESKKELDSLWWRWKGEEKLA